MKHCAYCISMTEASGAPTMDDLPSEMYTVPVGNVMMPLKNHHVSLSIPFL